MRTRLLTTAASSLVLIAGCSSSASSAATSPTPSATVSASVSASATASAGSSTAATVAAVTAVWTKFFDGSTPAATKVELLANGKQFAPVIAAQAASPMAKGAAATVSSVDVTSPTTATVHYSITLNGQSALGNQTGQATLISGSWHVGDASFCALLALEGSKVPGCPTS